MNEYRPLAPWGEDPDDPRLVWWVRLGERFQAEVQRTGQTDGVLVVFDRWKDMRPVHGPVPVDFGRAVDEPAERIFDRWAAMAWSWVEEAGEPVS